MRPFGVMGWWIREAVIATRRGPRGSTHRGLAAGIATQFAFNDRVTSESVWLGRVEAAIRSSDAHSGLSQNRDVELGFHRRTHSPRFPGNLTVPEEECPEPIGWC